MTEKYGFACNRVGDEPVLDEVLQGEDVLLKKVHIDEETGEVCDSAGNAVDVDALEDSEPGSADARQQLVEAQTIQGRYSGVQRSRRSNAETIPERFLVNTVQAAQDRVPGPYCPPEYCPSTPELEARSSQPWR